MRRRAGRGFTLFEVMVAVAILTILTTSLWGTISDTTRARRNAERVQDRYAQLRFALDRLARDLSMAFVSNHEDTLQTHRRTMFVGSDRGEVDELQFSAFAHERVHKDVDESDATLLTYRVGPDPIDPARQSLLRRETRRLANEDPRTIRGAMYPICEDVRRFNVRYYDAPQKSWRDDWSTLSADGRDYLPTKVRVELTVLDERAEEVTLTTQARIPLWQKLD